MIEKHMSYIFRGLMVIGTSNEEGLNGEEAELDLCSIFLFSTFNEFFILARRSAQSCFR